MNDSVYYKATDEDGNTILKHGWKKHKYLYIKNGKYVYPEDLKKSSSPYKGPTSVMRAQKAQKHYAFKDSQVSKTGTPTSWVKQGPVKQKKHVQMERIKKKNVYKGPSDAIQAQKAQHEKEFQKRVRAMNAHTVAKKNADMLKKKQDQQMKQIKANVKKQNAPSTKVKKAAKFATKVATRDAAAKMAATRYLVSKAAKSPTANAAKAKVRSVVSKGEYKLERAGQKFARDVKKSGAYKATRKATKRVSSAARKARTNAQDRALTSAEVRNKANSVRSKAEYKITRAGQKLANDAKPYTSSAKKQFNKASQNAGKVYNSAKKEFNKVSKNANKAYNSAKKKARKVSRSINKAKRAGKAYLNYLTR